MENEKKVLDAMEADIMKAQIPESEKNKLLKISFSLKNKKSIS